MRSAIWVAMMLVACGGERAEHPTDGAAGDAAILDAVTETAVVQHEPTCSELTDPESCGARGPGWAGDVPPCGEWGNFYTKDPACLWWTAPNGIAECIDRGWITIENKCADGGDAHG